MYNDRKDLFKKKISITNLDLIMHRRRQCVTLPTTRYIAKAVQHLFISRNVMRIFAKITRYLQSFCVNIIIIIFCKRCTLYVENFMLYCSLAIVIINCLEYQNVLEFPKLVTNGPR